MFPRSIDLPDDNNEPVAVAIFSLTPEGDYSMRMSTITGASHVMTSTEQAKALRMLATGVEAEAIAAASGDVTEMRTIPWQN